MEAPRSTFRYPRKSARNVPRRPFRELRLSQVELSEHYDVLREIGYGSFGDVCLARLRNAKGHASLVAIKTMKTPMESPSDCFLLREVQSLYSLPSHDCIVGVLDSFYDPRTRLFHMVMEHMDQNLYQLIKSRHGRPFEFITVQSIFIQILEALNHCHQNNYFHRDVKPENVLVNMIDRSGCVPVDITRGSGHQLATPPSTPVNFQVKLADFGLAREITSEPPYTAYVSTRWYRAPEVLLRDTRYSAPVDMWAFGAMAVEIITLQPLFPGQNEMDQLWQISQIMGSPGDWRDQDSHRVGGGPWSTASVLAKELGFTFLQTPPTPLDEVLGPSWPTSMADFATALLSWDPNRRLTAVDALRHSVLERRSAKRAKILSASDRQGYSAAMRVSDQSQATGADVKKGLFRNVQESFARRSSLDSIMSGVSHLYRSGNISPIKTTEEAEVKPSWFSRQKDTLMSKRVPESRVPDQDVPARNTRAKLKISSLEKETSQLLTKQEEQYHHCEYQESRSCAGETESTTMSIKTSSQLSYEPLPQEMQQLPVQIPLETLPARPAVKRFLSASSLPIRRLSVRKAKSPSPDIEMDSQTPSKFQATEGVPNPRRYSSLSGFLSHLTGRPKEIPTMCSSGLNISNPEQFLKQDPAVLVDNHISRSDNSVHAPQRTIHDTAAHKDGLHSKETPEKHPRRTGEYSTSMKRGFPEVVLNAHKGSTMSALGTGPISSRTRRAVSMKPALGPRTLDHPDEEAELLHVELQTAAHAIRHLASISDYDASAAKLPTKPVPSYAKSTAAWTRRSSQIGVNEVGGRSTGRKSTFSRTSLPLSPSPPIERSHHLH